MNRIIWIPLALSFLITAAFAVVDAMQERVSDAAYLVAIASAASVSQLPGIVIAVRHALRPTWHSTILLRPAFAIALLSLTIYAYLVMEGQSGPAEGASLLHMVTVPVALCVIAVWLFLLTASITAARGGRETT